jgi:hypothetical protein
MSSRTVGSCLASGPGNDAVLQTDITNRAQVKRLVMLLSPDRGEEHDALTIFSRTALHDRGGDEAVYFPQ